MFPFGYKKSELVAIGNEETGVIWLEKPPVLTVDLNPIPIQELLIKRADLDYFDDLATKRLSTERNIPIEDAEILLKGKVNDENKVQIAASVKVESLLTLEERRSYAAATASFIDHYLIATVLIHHCMVYDVTIAVDVDSCNEPAILPIEPLKWQLCAGTVLKVDRQKLELAKEANPGDEELLVKSIPYPIRSGAVAYELGEDNRYRKGDPHWSLEKTKQFLSEKQIGLLRNFYYQLAGVKTEIAEKKEQEEASDRKVIELPRLNQPTGSSATSESSPTESLIPLSNSKTLDLSPVS